MISANISPPKHSYRRISSTESIGSRNPTSLFKPSYLYFVLYHVVFWSLFPLPKISAAGKAHLGWYLGLSAACVAAFVAISPIGPVFTSRYAVSIFQRQFILWTYIHITSSFLLSNAHPEWIVNLFRPIKSAAALAEPTTRAA